MIAKGLCSCSNMLETQPGVHGMVTLCKKHPAPTRLEILKLDLKLEIQRFFLIYPMPILV